MYCKIYFKVTSMPLKTPKRTSSCWCAQAVTWLTVDIRSKHRRVRLGSAPAWMEKWVLKWNQWRWWLYSLLQHRYSAEQMLWTRFNGQEPSGSDIWIAWNELWPRRRKKLENKTWPDPLDIQHVYMTHFFQMPCNYLNLMRGFSVTHNL